MVIDGNSLTLEGVIKVARFNEPVIISEEALTRVKQSRDYVDRLVAEERIVYGVTTGFGKFSDVHISASDTEALQANLIMSHACGTGPIFPEEVARAIILLRANALSKGYSGIRPQTLQALVDMLNNGVHPVIPEKGSLGASGDLAPLAHMALPLIGMGEAFYNGRRMDGGEALHEAGLKPVVLTAKEGLALINGTQVMTAVGALAAYDALCLSKLCDISSALTGEAFHIITDVFMEELHRIRPHKGQLETASNMRRLLEGSERTSHQGEVRVQDAYSLRCIPQIHGASKDAIQYTLEKIAIEINAVTDNPIILSELDLAISGGNFHGQPMALTFDFLGIAAAELANVAERRIERLVNSSLGGLPAFLTENGGLHSGFMIAQYSAAALVSENKVLAHPASVDSIPSSGGQEDHVSMGTIAARKARDICDNLSRVIAIELTAAAQGIDLSPPTATAPGTIGAPGTPAADGSLNVSGTLGKGTGIAYDMVRKTVSKMTEDRILYKDFDAVLALVKNNSIVSAVEAAIGELS